MPGSLAGVSMLPRCRATGGVPMGTMTGVERPTTVVRLDAGPVEYRLERRGDATVVVFHGGHHRAGLALGEEVFADAGYSVLVPSRPGYGITPVAAVVGTSGGGPTAVTTAARHPDLVQRLILQCAVGPLPYPDRRTRLGAHVMFAGATEGATWRAVRTLMRLAPETSLRLWMGQLSTLPARNVVTALRPEDRAMVVALFSQMRSGRGFRNDLRPTPDLTADVSQPTLVIATRHDGGVPFAHAQSLAAAIRHAELVESEADSHLIWLGQDWPSIAETIRAFLTTDPTLGPAP